MAVGHLRALPTARGKPVRPVVPLLGECRSPRLGETRGTLVSDGLPLASEPRRALIRQPSRGSGRSLLPEETLGSADLTGGTGPKPHPSPAAGQTSRPARAVTLAFPAVRLAGRPERSGDHPVDRPEGQSGWRANPPLEGEPSPGRARKPFRLPRPKPRLQNRRSAGLPGRNPSNLCVRLDRSRYGRCGVVIPLWDVSIPVIPGSVRSGFPFLPFRDPLHHGWSPRGPTTYGMRRPDVKRESWLVFACFRFLSRPI